MYKAILLHASFLNVISNGHVTGAFNLSITHESYCITRTLNYSYAAKIKDTFQVLWISLVLGADFKHCTDGQTAARSKAHAYFHSFITENVSLYTALSCVGTGIAMGRSPEVMPDSRRFVTPEVTLNWKTNCLGLNNGDKTTDEFWWNTVQ